MTPRERVRNLLKGEKPDQIPNGFGATINTGLHVLAYNKLLRILGIDNIIPRIMSFAMNALFDLHVMEAVEADMISLGIKITPSGFWGYGCAKDWKTADIWNQHFLISTAWDIVRDSDGSTWIKGYKWGPFDFNMPVEKICCDLKCPSGGYYFDPIAVPGLARIENPTPDDYHPPVDYPDEWLRKIETSARWLYENTEYSILCDEMTNDLQLTPDGLQSWFMRMLNDPRVVHEFLEKACEAALCKIKLVNQAVGKYSDILMIAHDFGDRRGIQVGPDLWREIYKPHYKRLFSGWKNITRMKIGMHSCGSIVDILEDLIDSGLDIINPIQISARGMDPAILTRKFGNRAILYGGSYDSVLNTVDLPAEVVYERVRTNIKTLATNGRYIFSGVHNLQWDIPDSHLIAILQAYCDCKANV